MAHTREIAPTDAGWFLGAYESITPCIAVFCTLLSPRLKVPPRAEFEAETPVADEGSIPASSISFLANCLSATDLPVVAIGQWPPIDPLFHRGYPTLPVVVSVPPVEPFSQVGQSSPEALRKKGHFEGAVAQPRNRRIDRRRPSALHTREQDPGTAPEVPEPTQIGMQFERPQMVAKPAETKKKTAQKTLSRRRKILPRTRSGSKSVQFSQLHALAIADLDDDGLKDIITGKTYGAPNGNNPGANDPPVIYAFRLRRIGSVRFVPEFVSGNTGVGRRFVVRDVDGDGRRDIVCGEQARRCHLVPTPTRVHRSPG